MSIEKPFKLTKTRRDQLQFNAFKAFYRRLPEMSREERLITAICMSDDDQFDQALMTKQKVIKEWTEIPKRGRWNRRKKDG